MAKLFSIASWNVEHFQDEPERVGRVVTLLSQQTPDVFALYEVEGKTVFNALVSKLPDYTFHITEGPQVQEILVGVRHGLTAFFTQKIEFKSGDTALRPGALLTLTIAGKNYPLLFLHTKSGNDPKGLGLRDDMLVRAVEFRKALDKAAGGKGRANYIFLGDLNTMGMHYEYVKGQDIGPEVELEKLSKLAARYKMRLLTKDAPATWWNGPESALPASNLDHVVAATHLTFTKFGGADVSALGWPKEPTPAKQAQWIKKHSDHALLYFEVSG